MDVSALLASLDVLVLERMTDGRFASRVLWPAWCAPLLPDALARGESLPIEELFPFLEAFLPQATEVWRDGGRARVSSGFWTVTAPDETELHLEATAVRVDGSDALLIRRDDERFAQAQTILQRARELRLTHDALVRETEQKEILTHTIVHDLAAPLHSILGALSLLQEMPLQQDVARWVELAFRAATRQRKLVQEILDVFVAERRAASDLGLASPNLCEVMEHVASEQEPVARQRNVRLSTDPKVVPCLVRADETRLFRVLANLVDNAIRHSPPSGEVRLGLAIDGGYAVVTVDDDGPGVSPELLPRLFEKLGRGHGTAGTGLGLYFCRITVESWGGGIGYEMRPEGGARFWVRLPLESQPAIGEGGARHGQVADPG